MYGALSRFYDLLIADFPYDGLAGILSDAVELKGKTVLDLCTGTGNAAIRMARLGATVTGLDISTEMLAVAAQKARSEGARVTFVAGDVNNLKIDKKFDVATSFCDGINYLDPARAAAAFKRIYGNLNDGGVLFFDISTEYKLKNVLSGNLYFEDKDNLTYFFRSTLARGGKSVRMDLTFFELEGEVYRRYDDVSSQFVHTKESLCAALAEAGFCAEAFDADNVGKSRVLKEPQLTTQRLLIIAKKGAK